MRRMAYHSRGATPLMLAILCGNFEAAAMLLVEGARLEMSQNPPVNMIFASCPSQGYQGSLALILSLTIADIL